MLLVWVAGCESTYWIENMVVRDEGEAIQIMLDKGIWPDQMELLDGDAITVLPTDYLSLFDKRFTEAYHAMVTSSEEERDRREYERLKKKYE